MESSIFNWIKIQRPFLEEVLIKAAKDFTADKGSNNFPTFLYDVQQTSSELWNLQKGNDLCYDRPSIGFTYSLWYHPKRVNTFLHFLFKLLLNHSKDERIDLYDLGAGTGAVQWAVGIIYAALRNYSAQVPKIRIVNVDSSPFMLNYNENFLWKHFINQYPVCKDIQIEYSINSWVNTQMIAPSNIWLTASYLFDHSENSAELSKEFQKLTEQFKPSRILLLSAKFKETLVNSVADSIINLKLGYQNLSSTYPVSIFSGLATNINNFRMQVQSLHNYGFSGNVKWNIDGLYGRVVILPQAELPIFISELPIYMGAQADRIKIHLSDEQLDASKHTNKSTLIDGPAGSGKTVVLSERIKNIVESNNYNPEIRILVTSFNKGIVQLIGNWLESLLDPERFKRVFQEWKGVKKEHSFFYFTGSKFSNITLLNFDQLASRLGGIKSTPIDSKSEFVYMNQAVDLIVQEQRIDKKKYASILDPRFLIEEYHRIIFGQICNSERQYQSVERRGRGNYPMLKTKTNRRKIIWKIISRYLELLKKNKIDSFITWRYKFLKSILKNGFAEGFDYVFVDEIQDCTRGDFVIFGSLAKDNNIVAAGDLAQSINLGACSFIPSDYERKKLKQSYRLPLRVSQAIKPLSEKIQAKHKKRSAVGNPDIIVPYKGSPPGSRPILVYAKSIDEVINKIKYVFNEYGLYKLNSISIFEEDEELSNLLEEKGVANSAEKIKKAKGLERSCVLWSTRINVNSPTDIEESIYTIITRTTSILIIAIIGNIQQSFKDILVLFNNSWLINWDKESEIFMSALRQEYKEMVEESDSDDDVELKAEEIDDLEYDV